MGVANGYSTGQKTRQAVSAAVIGNVLEWYDFAVYGYVAVYHREELFSAGR